MRIYVMTYELIDHFYIVLFNPAGGAGVGTLWGGRILGVDTNGILYGWANLGETFRD